MLSRLQDAAKKVPFHPMKQQQAAYKFNDRYQEKVTLRNGVEVILRPVIPADKLLLAQGMDDFSPESRYQRFLGAREGLSEADLRYLTEVDGVDHFAIGALVWPDRGVGVARFVRFGEEREIAEPAIAVFSATAPICYPRPSQQEMKAANAYALSRWMPIMTKNLKAPLLTSNNASLKEKSTTSLQPAF